MVPVTNEPKPWSVHVQTTRSDMSDLKHAQLRDFLAGNYMTGSGVNKKLAVHYKFWTKVILPEAEAKAHLEICQLSGVASPSASPCPLPAPPLLQVPRSTRAAAQARPVPQRAGRSRGRPVVLGRADRGAGARRRPPAQAQVKKRHRCAVEVRV